MQLVKSKGINESHQDEIPTTGASVIAVQTCEDMPLPNLGLVLF
jgi:hypothetical protein